MKTLINKYVGYIEELRLELKDIPLNEEVEEIRLISKINTLKNVVNDLKQIK